MGEITKPLSRVLAIPIALAGMWVLACAGSFAAVHSTQWWFIDLRGYDAATIGQLGTFFLAYTAAQIPAACLAGMVIVASDFTHPLRATFWTVVGYHLVFSAIRAVRWPWTAFHDLDQAIPLLAQVLSTLLLIGTSVLVAWVMPRWHVLCQRYFTR